MCTCSLSHSAGLGSQYKKKTKKKTYVGNTLLLIPSISKLAYDSNAGLMFCLFCLSELNKLTSRCSAKRCIYLVCGSARSIDARLVSAGCLKVNRLSRNHGGSTSRVLKAH